MKRENLGTLKNMHTKKFLNKIKLKEKMLISIIGLSAIFMIINPNKSNAALQANGGAPTTATIAEWILNIRMMEATGGTLGLTDTINGTDLTSSAETSNNLDIHMEKNTEYGAMAILSASAYGNQNKINSGETTTGNKTGIVINLNKEWVSAGSLTALEQYVNANAKYKNYYTTTYVPKKGDTITETAGWHGSGASTWISASSNLGNSVSGLLRAYSGSLFSYNGFGYHWGAVTEIQDPHYTKPWSTRAVVVVGNGF